MNPDINTNALIQASLRAGHGDPRAALDYIWRLCEHAGWSREQARQGKIIGPVIEHLEAQRDVMKRRASVFDRLFNRK